MAYSRLLFIHWDNGVPYFTPAKVNSFKSIFNEYDCVYCFMTSCTYKKAVKLCSSKIVMTPTISFFDKQRKQNVLQF